MNFNLHGFDVTFIPYYIKLFFLIVQFFIFADINDD